MKFISILPDEKRLTEFCELQQNIYSAEDKKYAMNPLQCRKLVTLPIPFEKEAFLIQNESGRTVGRFLLHTSAKARLGHWSFFALAKDVTDSELKLIDGFMGEWFQSRGISEVVGPYYFTTYFPYRMRLDRDPVSYPWEPKQPHHELEMVKKMGHRIHELYATNLLKGFGHFMTKGQKEHEALLKEGFVFRPIKKDHLEEEVKLLYDMSMRGFTDNYLFAPIPFALFREIYVPSFQGADLRLSHILYSPDGKPAGFNFTFPEGNKLVIKSCCVLPEFRGRGLFNAGIYDAVMKGRTLCPELTDVITALVHEGNAASKHVADGSSTHERHEYALLIKDFTP